MTITTVALFSKAFRSVRSAVVIFAAASRAAAATEAGHRPDQRDLDLLGMHDATFGQTIGR